VGKQQSAWQFPETSREFLGLSSVWAQTTCHSSSLPAEINLFESFPPDRNSIDIPWYYAAGVAVVRREVELGTADLNYRRPKGQGYRRYHSNSSWSLESRHQVKSPYAWVWYLTPVGHPRRTRKHRATPVRIRVGRWNTGTPCAGLKVGHLTCVTYRLISWKHWGRIKIWKADLVGLGIPAAPCEFGLIAGVPAPGETPICLGTLLP